MKIVPTKRRLSLLITYTIISVFSKTTLKLQQNLQIDKVYFVQKVESDKTKQKMQKNCEVFLENRHI